MTNMWSFGGPNRASGNTPEATSNGFCVSSLKSVGFQVWAPGPKYLKPVYPRNTPSEPIPSLDFSLGRKTKKNV